MLSRSENFVSFSLRIKRDKNDHHLLNIQYYQMQPLPSKAFPSLLLSYFNLVEIKFKPVVGFERMSHHIMREFATP